jgi:hypothetical protein
MRNFGFSHNGATGKDDAATLGNSGPEQPHIAPPVLSFVFVNQAGGLRHKHDELSIAHEAKAR